MEKTKKKIELFDTWMQGEFLLVHLDARKDGVQVPAHLATNPSLTLKLSYLFQGETVRDETEITSFLRFNNAYEKCVIPWTAIWGFTSAKDENQIWPEDLPKEVLIQLAKAKLSEVGKKLLGKGKQAKHDKKNPDKRASGQISPAQTSPAQTSPEQTSPEQTAKASSRKKTAVLKRIK